VAQGAALIPDRYGALPRWAADGGNGSVARVEDMTNEEIARCYRVLKRVLMEVPTSMLEASEIVSLMNALEEELT